jgi:signal transduction histidine kinase
MGAFGPVNPGAASGPPGRRPGGPSGSPRVPGPPTSSAQPNASDPAAPSAQPNASDAAVPSALPGAPDARAALTAPAALTAVTAAGAALRAPFTARARRDLLFCLVEAPLGLCILAAPLLLAGVLFPLRLAVYGTKSAAGAVHPAAVVPIFAGACVILLLVAMVPRFARGLGAVHRGLAAQLLGEQVGEPAPPRPVRGGFRRLAAMYRDRPGWRAAGYLVVKLPITVVEIYAVAFAVLGLADLSYPFWWPLFRNHPPGTVLQPVPVVTAFGTFDIRALGGTFAAFAAGAAMLLAAPWVARGAAAADCWLMRGLLGPGRLALRVADLEQTRALAVDDSAALLRRVERDLHDGAQIRLATLAMNLGMARDKLGSDADPEVRELVDAAHQGAKDALVELRNLARGIHPPALDSGLADALATLAAGSAIPVELTADIPQRPAPAIETIAYFCAAELLANAAKHSQAGKIDITLSGQGQNLVLHVADDGAGGADPAGGSGLSGLAQRVRTVDGRIEIASPPGGPTRITVTLPMHA